MWYGVRVWGVRIRSKEGDEGGNKRAEGGVERFGRELWIWISAFVLLLCSSFVPSFSLYLIKLERVKERLTYL